MTQDDSEYDEQTLGDERGGEDEREQDDDLREAGMGGRTGRLSACYLFVGAFSATAETIARVQFSVARSGGNWVDSATSLAQSSLEVLLFGAILAVVAIVLAPRSFQALSTKRVIMATMSGAVVSVLYW